MHLCQKDALRGLLHECEQHHFFVKIRRRNSQICRSEVKTIHNVYKVKSYCQHAFWSVEYVSYFDRQFFELLNQRRIGVVFEYAWVVLNAVVLFEEVGPVIAVHVGCYSEWSIGKVLAESFHYETFGI